MQIHNPTEGTVNVPVTDIDPDSGELVVTNYLFESQASLEVPEAHFARVLKGYDLLEPVFGV